MQTFPCICVTMLCIAAVNAHPKANKKGPHLEWYENGVFYQIYPRSFKDSNGDGIGDIRGIIQELDYLKELGVDGAWISPIFKSPMVDFGYDIEDFYDVDPMFGTMADLEELFREAEKRNIKIILDFVPNHSSDKCEWFKKSVKREGKYTDYYVWAAGKNNNTEPPNNWVSIFYGSAWTFNEERNQWYYHAFAKEQPDLNFRNTEMLKEMKEILLFWLKKGASGFRIDALNFIFEYEDLRDEPLTGITNDPKMFQYTTQEYTTNLNENFEVAYKFRNIFDEYNNDHPKEELVLLGEAYAQENDYAKYFGDGKGRMGLHVPFNFILITEMDKDSSAQFVKTLIDDRIKLIPDGHRPNWQVGNHDRSRIGSRYCERRIDGFNALIMTLPGIAVTYYGEEIGMVDNRNISFGQTVDPQAKGLDPTSNWLERSRDPQRTPMQWDSTKFAGFMPENATAMPWLPIHRDYKDLNVAQQRNNPRSTLNFYKRLVQLRKENAFTYGSFRSTVLNENVFAYVREFEGSDTYWVLINFGNRVEKIDMTQSNLDASLLQEFEVAAVSSDSCHEQGAKLKASAVILVRIIQYFFRQSFLEPIMNLITILPIALVLAVLSTGVLAGGKCSDPYCSDSDCDGETEGWVKVDGEERWVGKGEPIPKTKAGDRWLLVNYEARFFKDGESPATHPGQPVAEEDRNIKYCSGGDQPGCPHSRGKKKGGLIKSIKKGLSKKK